MLTCRRHTYKLGNKSKRRRCNFKRYSKTSAKSLSVVKQRHLFLRYEYDMQTWCTNTVYKCEVQIWCTNMMQLATASRRMRSIWPAILWCGYSTNEHPTRLFPTKQHVLERHYTMAIPTFKNFPCDRCVRIGLCEPNFAKYQQPSDNVSIPCAHTRSAVPRFALDKFIRIGHVFNALLACCTRSARALCEKGHLRICGCYNATRH